MSPAQWLADSEVALTRSLRRTFLLPTEPVVDVQEYLAAGGAGFATARKWRSVRDGGPGRRFVVVNAAEGEPATFKDRLLIRRDPYRVIEGAAIAALVVGAGTIYLATKRSYSREVRTLRDAYVRYPSTSQ